MDELPLFPLNVVLFPGMSLPLHVFEERYRAMISHCLQREIPFGVVLIKTGEEVGGPAVPFDIGTTAKILQLQYLPDGRMNLLTVGQQRFRILRVSNREPYLTGQVEPLTSQGLEDPALPEKAEKVSALFAEYYRLYLSLSQQWARRISLPQNPDSLSDFVAARLAVDNAVKQEILETLHLPRRLDLEASLLNREILLLTERLRIALRRRWWGYGVLN